MGYEFIINKSRLGFMKVCYGLLRYRSQENISNSNPKKGIIMRAEFIDQESEVIIDSIDEFCDLFEKWEDNIGLLRMITFVNNKKIVWENLNLN